MTAVIGMVDNRNLLIDPKKLKEIFRFAVKITKPKVEEIIKCVSGKPYKPNKRVKNGVKIQTIIVQASIKLKDKRTLPRALKRLIKGDR